MKTLILSAIRCSLMFLLPTVTYAISAQWDEAPMSDDWNTAANWKQNGVPNGRDDIATFGFSTTLSVSISEDTEVNGIVLTAEAPPRRYVMRSENHTLTISGTGITNNSGQQSIVADAGGHIEFTNNASATIEGGDTLFFSNLKALVSGGSGGVTTFSGDSHAANGDFFNHGGTFDGEEGGSTIFSDTSHADSASLMAFGGTNGGQGGKILFQGKSDGGTSSVEVFGNGTLDLSNHDEIVGRFTIGSIAGDGKVLLNEERTLNLFIGGNNLDTTFSGASSAAAVVTRWSKRAQARSRFLGTPNS
jgi:hypothetical protein